jgi:probable addiction module antidote protein
MAKTRPYDSAKYLDSPEAIAEYLTAALETTDAAFIARAIGTAARACGMTQIAREAGLSRENLYRSLNGQTRTELDTVVRVLRALGVRLTASTTKRPRVKRSATWWLERPARKPRKRRAA